MSEAATIKEIKALVRPGIARTAQTTNPGDNGRMYMEYFFQNLDFSPAPLAQDYTSVTQVAEDDGTVNLQEITTGVISLGPVNWLTSGAQLHVIVWCGDDAGTNRDDVIALEVTYDDVGLRNY